MKKSPMLTKVGIILSLIFLGGCLSSVAITAEPKVAIIKIPEEGSAFIGTIDRNVSLGVGNALDFCLEDGALWQGSAWRVGDFHVFGLDPKVAPELAGKTVLLLGEKRMSLADKVVNKGPCPKSHREPTEMQLRSDWLAAETNAVGSSTHKLLTQRPYWQVRSAQAVRVLALTTSDEETVQVEVLNPLNRTLTDLTIVWHYEGGPGKPMPHFVEHTVTLRPGAAHRSQQPRVLHAKSGRAKKSWWKLHKVHVKHSERGLTIDTWELVPRIKTKSR